MVSLKHERNFSLSYGKIDAVLFGDCSQVMATLREDNERNGVNHNIGDDIKSKPSYRIDQLGIISTLSLASNFSVAL